jgi:glucose-6-phosphate isomerase
VITGGKPSNMLVTERLTPEAFGALLALYEHKVFVQGVLWHIDSFDQWGVELGKVLGDSIFRHLCGDESSESVDSSTRKMIERFKAANRNQS